VAFDVQGWKHIDAYQRSLARQRLLKEKYGVACPLCSSRHPKAAPKILLPGAYCYRCRHRDPRPPLTDAQRWEVLC
jgi:hypothetical protein